MAYRIISDGSCDLPEEMTREKGIRVVPFYVTMDDKTYVKENVEISKSDFYKWMVENKGKFPKSSMPPTSDFLEAFEEAARAGEDIICITITRKFSSCYEVALAAKALLADEYPDIKVEVIDSTVDTVLQGLVVLELVKLRDAGFGFEESVRRLRDILPTGRIFFTVGNLDYLRAGGRIGKLAGMAGALLGIRPLITLKEGEIFPSGITRSRRKSMDMVGRLAEKYVTETFSSVDEYVADIGYGWDYDEGVAFRDLIAEHLKSIGHDVELPIYHIGAAISVHTGPYPLGFSLVKKADLRK